MLSSSIRSGLPVGASLPAQAPQLRLPGSHAAVLAPCRAGRSGIALEPLVASSSSGGSSSSISSSSMGSGATSSGVAAASSAWPASSSPAGGRALAGSALQRLRLGPMDVLTASMLPQAAESGEEGGDGYKVVSRVAYQGVPGAYSEIAANKACPGWEPLPCEHFEVAFQAISQVRGWSRGRSPPASRAASLRFDIQRGPALSRATTPRPFPQWMAERAVLPIENSLGGSIHAVYDLLMRYQLHIVGEVSVEVNHCLLALPGVAKSEIRRVLSHPQALAQTDGYTRRMPGVVREAVDDTAGAAKMIAENGWRCAGERLALPHPRSRSRMGPGMPWLGIQTSKRSEAALCIRVPSQYVPSVSASLALASALQGRRRGGEPARGGAVRHEHPG